MIVNVIMRTVKPVVSAISKTAPCVSSARKNRYAAILLKRGINQGKPISEIARKFKGEEDYLFEKACEMYFEPSVFAKHLKK